MLSKKYRLKKYSAVIATYKNNDIISDANISIYFGKPKQDKSLATKFAFVVSKKIHKRAVKRNRIKRLMREAVRIIIKKSEFDSLNNYMSVVCCAKPLSLDKSFMDLYTSITNIVMKKG